LTTNGNFVTPSTTLVFPAGTSADQSFTVRVFDDQAIESNETIALSFIVNNELGGNAAKGEGTPNTTITITDNDFVPQAETPLSAVIGSYTTNLPAPFQGNELTSRQQTLYTATELTAAGLQAGRVVSVTWFVTLKQSTIPYSGLTIKLKNVTQTTLPSTAIEGGTIVYGPVDYSTFLGENSFTLSNNFTWDGTSNLLVDICFSNSSTSAFDRIQCTSGISGSVGIRNQGFDGIVVKSGHSYLFSMFTKQLSSEPVSLKISLQTRKGDVLAEQKLTVSSMNWEKQTAVLTSSANYDTASLVIALISKGKTALDVVSLFPEHTFKNRPNGMRADLAQLLADMKPAFIRFPGGCLVHGDGLGNMYRWKNTIGPLEQRVEQRNIWGYHQTAGLGYYEYFQFCEDIGAKPLPVLPAAVSCQNSGGTWRIGGTGQRALALEDMKDYIQEVLDLIEWANGPVNSTWGSKRAAAGHPASFNLQYVGIGNEEKITPEFEQRLKIINDAVKARYPEITVIGTSGPFHSG